MGENIESIKKLRADLEEGGMKKERLDAFDALFNTYKRKLTEDQDFSDSQMYDFYQHFSFEVGKLEEGE